ncbi:MAG: DUF3876 domain-containing protein [Patescibacteria group bacterium]|jgi:hypothetical protein|nr:DUF3876 domain-containing protein [Patescibacteria group bacterium]
MKSKINQEVSVISVFSSRLQTAKPHLISWQNKDYKVGEIGYHHKIYSGRICHHIYELTDQDQTLWFRLSFNTDNLRWVLEEISDGNTD